MRKSVTRPILIFIEQGQTSKMATVYNPQGVQAKTPVIYSLNFNQATKKGFSAVVENPLIFVVKTGLEIRVNLLL
jgi:hypothetical protein